ncbi:MAG: hypothetical protein R8P61_16955 [Bacteroidia bacterium]|nr:hypothetical protein [Bacteroidia bacterium]
MANKPQSKKALDLKSFSIPIIWEGEDEVPEMPFPPAMELAFSAATNAILGGMQAMMQEGVESYSDYSSGKIDQNQYTYRVFVKGTQSAIRNGSKTVVALGVKEGAKVVAKKVGKESLKRFAKSNAMTAICFGLVDQGTDAYKFSQGQMSGTEFKIRTSENIGSTSGAIGGAAIGAMLGSIVPGLGTGAGAALGYMAGALGASGGANLGKSVGEYFFLEDQSDKKEDSSEKS